MAGSPKKPQPFRESLLHILVRTELYHETAIVSGVGFALDSGHLGIKKARQSDALDSGASNANALQVKITESALRTYF